MRSRRLGSNFKQPAPWSHSVSAECISFRIIHDFSLLLRAYGEANEFKRLLVLDAGTEFKLYSLDPNTSFIRSYPTVTNGDLFPRQVVFGENEKVVVGGSKEGVVHVFDTKTGAPLDVLHHTPKTKVLAVAVSDTNLQLELFTHQLQTYAQGSTHFIAGASSDGGSSAIYIWSYSPPIPKRRRKSRTFSTRQLLAIIILTLTALATSLLYVDYKDAKASAARTKVCICLLFCSLLRLIL